MFKTSEINEDDALEHEEAKAIEEIEDAEAEEMEDGGSLRDVGELEDAEDIKLIEKYVKFQNLNNFFIQKSFIKLTTNINLKVIKIFTDRILEYVAVSSTNEVAGTLYIDLLVSLFSVKGILAFKDKDIFKVFEVRFYFW